ncbi:MAG: glutamyl-tRNA reductase, partial [Phycisphaerae bacterium]|nr:glutamyl-tRNA reductase [Phycisphaerae bacterium]
MDLSVIGVNHHTAPVEVRERFALSGELASRLLRAVHTESVFDEALVIDTCNRTEIYFVSRSDADALTYLIDHVGRLKGETLKADESAFFRHDGPEAVRHLFRVAAALDSQIVGEHQVLGQVRAAYLKALEARTAGFLLNKLLHAALRVGKRTQSETQLGRGSASVAQTAVDLAGQVFADLTDKTVLIVGAGTTAETAAKRLIAPGVGRVIVANRTLERAELLADRLARGGDDDDNGEDDVPPEGQCPALQRDMGH